MATEGDLRETIGNLEDDITSLAQQLEAEQARVAELIDVIATAEHDIYTSVFYLQAPSVNLNTPSN